MISAAAALLAAVFFVAFPVRPASAWCAIRDQIVNRLTAKYGEAQAAAGLGSTGIVIELWVSKENKTWTLFYTRPSGVSCMIGAGSDWVEAVKKPKGRGT